MLEFVVPGSYVIAYFRVGVAGIGKFYGIFRPTAISAHLPTTRAGKPTKRSFELPSQSNSYSTMPKYQDVFYEPNVTEHGLPRNPFKSCVVPRPIGWISTLSAEGVPNLAPYPSTHPF